MNSQHTPKTGIAGHSPAGPDIDRHLYDLSLKLVQERLAEAGLPRSDKTIRRYCQDGRLDCMKVDGRSGQLYLVRSASVEHLIGELMQVRAIADGAGHSPASTEPTGASSSILGASEPDIAGHSPAGPDTASQPTLQIYKEAAENIAGHSRTMSGTDRLAPEDPMRGDVNDPSIFKHPYVLKLEERIDRLEGRLDDQVRRTEEIQTNARRELIELQRASQVAQSKTLAEYFLRAKALLLGGSDGAGEKGPSAAMIDA